MIGNTVDPSRDITEQISFIPVYMPLLVLAAVPSVLHHFFSIKKWTVKHVEHRLLGTLTGWYNAHSYNCRSPGMSPDEPGVVKDNIEELHRLFAFVIHKGLMTNQSEFESSK